MVDSQQPLRQKGHGLSQHRTVLVAAFEGWNDAGQAASGTVRHLLQALEVTVQEVDHICCSTYYDYQYTRPLMCTVDGRRQIIWPEVTFSTVDVSDNLTLLLEVGPEPNFRWMDFARQSLSIADDYEIDEIITLGSMFNDVPHTRPLPISEQDSAFPPDPSTTYSGPVGIPSILDFTAAESGYRTESLWVSVPQYAGADDCPYAILTLVKALSHHLGTDLPLGNLPQRSRQWKQSADTLLVYNDDLNHYVHRLEKIADTEGTEETEETVLPPALSNQLIRETENFLKSLDSPDSPSPGSVPDSGSNPGFS